MQLLFFNGVRAAVRVEADAFLFPQQFDVITGDLFLVCKCFSVNPTFSFSQKTLEKMKNSLVTGLVELSIQNAQ